jgi:disulfide bond formation protein DsbB
MRGSIKTLLVCGALIAAGLGAAAPAAASVARSTSVAGSTTDGCSATVSNITWETLDGKAVVTFTGQVECNSSATQIYLHPRPI